MKTTGEIKDLLQKKELDSTLLDIYLDESRLDYQRQRYIDALTRYEELYGAGEIAIFSAPGRSEIGGNHTDHQHGEVLAASINLDAIAITAPVDEPVVRVVSDGYDMITVSLDDLAVKDELKGTTDSLIRGVLEGIQKHGGKIGGFRAYITSDVLIGAGLSSSAAFETIIGTIISGIYNDMKLSPVDIAIIGQYAENVHFGKPSGLMDQLACALDGAVYIDFAAGEIAPVAAPFADMGLTLSLTDTGGSHAGLTAAYAALPADMCRVARRFGAETLSQVDPADFYAHRQPGLADDRAAHFFEENARVPLMRDALVHRDAETYLRLMNASGRSSEQLLRNIRAPGGDDRLERGLARAAALLDGVGAWRVHGGGFAGCVQALMPRDAFPAYRKGMEALFGPNSCRELHITRAK